MKHRFCILLLLAACKDDPPPPAPPTPAAPAGHWAFRAPVKVGDGRASVDAFINARLATEKLTPGPEADRTTLLRRLSLDLIGLPPTPEEVDAFLADKSPGAWEKQVDRLLASPHYGERWARLWLDGARYADSDGFEKDKSRVVWAWRDWVINAFNRDLPYDRFLIEQIAGDLLPDATQDQIVATGFLRNSMINEEGGVDPEQFRMEAMFDRMDAIGKSMLGLTIQCAQCHNHKFDPFSQEEYYRLFAFLNNSAEGSAPVYSPDELRKRAEILSKIAAIEEDLKASRPGWRAEMEAYFAAPRAAWTVLRPAVEEISTGGQKYLPQEDGSLLALSYAPTKHKVMMTADTGPAPITGFRLELLRDPNLPYGGPGRSPQGTAALSEFEVEAAPAGEPAKKVRVKFADAVSDFVMPEMDLLPMYNDKSNKKRVIGPVAWALDGKDETAWGIDAGPGRRNRPRTAVFKPAEPIAHPHGSILTIYLKQNHGGWNSDDNQSHNLGRFRLSITSSPEPLAMVLPPDVEEAPFSHWRTTVPEWKDANSRIDALWKEHPEGTSQLVLHERENPRLTSVLKRGDFLKPERPVEGGTPAFLHPFPPDAPRNRLGLARWLADRRSPTTARSFVNRVWHAFFGTGLVISSEDLGKQSEAPSHPELLDWLAVEFMDNGWSVKKLQRLIVTSSAYRRSSKVTATDPYNRLLARGPRFRVDAEIVRDIALSASGLLNPAVGGPSVYPPLPEFLLQPPVSYGPKVWTENKDAARYRRALYTFRYRSIPYPALEAFDAPNGDASCVRRSRSNTPLQALAMLNEPLSVECAVALGERARADGVIAAFRRCVARAPTDEESKVLTEFLAAQQKRFGGEAKEPWTALARVMLNLDETITKE